MIGSTHNHSTGSDGKLTPEQVVKKAIELKWDYVYFTEHYKTNPKLTSMWGKDFFTEEYLEQIKNVKEKYKDKIDICFGTEFDWLEENKDWIKNEIKKHDFDYIISGIHKLKYKNEFRGMEKGEDYRKESEKIFGGAKKYVQEYYKQIRNIIKSKIFDCIVHLDYIRIYNKELKSFNENEDWYKKEIIKCLDLIKKYKTVLEVNQGGTRKTGEQFPSTWIIEQAYKRNIPITLGLDAHHKEHYNNEYLKELITLVKKVGYKEHVRFVKRKMIKMKL